MVGQAPVTLRLRLVLAVVGLLTVGFLLFGVVTTSAYERAQRDRLDDQVRSAVPLVGVQLRQAAGLALFGPREGTVRSGSPSLVVPPGTYGELRDADGEVLSRVQLQIPGDTPTQPDLPADLSAGTGVPFDVSSISGRGRWRALVVSERDGTLVVVALPLSEVEAATRRLVAIEAATAAALLLVLAAGTWLVLRRGLRPLEQMAATASTITAGDLSTRVEPADDRSEVGQLGLALNTMLDSIEGSFHERERTERFLRRFLSDAAHELRTPLTSIQGFAELFRLRPDEGQVDDPVILRRIEEESARMRRLVEDMLLLARVEEAQPLPRTDVDLAVVAADACSDAVALDPTRRVTLDAPHPVVVHGVADHLRQAVANIVANAVRHTPAGTPVEVRAVADSDRAVVSVRDHGAGLDAEALAHAFDRFWRGDPSRSGDGTGLGLAIVQGIAVEHGGEVAAANAVGGGACFTLSLPLHARQLDEVDTVGRRQPDRVREPHPRAVDVAATGLAPPSAADLRDVGDDRR